MFTVKREVFCLTGNDHSYSELAITCNNKYIQVFYSSVDTNFPPPADTFFLCVQWARSQETHFMLDNSLLISANLFGETCMAREQRYLDPFGHFVGDRSPPRGAL